jgi:hypothetical protein
VLPNPENVQPVLDTEIRPPQKTNANIENYRTPRVQRLPQGMLVPGNIDINNRPVVKNADGTQSTEYSTSFENEHGQEVLIPTVIGGRFFTPDGKKPRVGSPAEKKMIQAAIAFHRSEPNTPHLGVFDSVENANAYAQALHDTPRNQGGEPEYISPVLQPRSGRDRVQFPSGHVVSMPSNLSPSVKQAIAKSVYARLQGLKN